MELQEEKAIAELSADERKHEAIVKVDGFAAGDCLGTDEATTAVPHDLLGGHGPEGIPVTVRAVLCLQHRKEIARQPQRPRLWAARESVRSLRRPEAQEPSDRSLPLP